MATEEEQRAALATTAPGAPVTFERLVPTELNFPKPYMPRALEAVDSEHPYGTIGYPNRNLSILQQHVDYFDMNHDGKIYPWETYQGMRKIGFNVFISVLAMFFINFAFSYPTLPSWIPSPLFVIYTRNIHKCKHGSDSETYDTEGRFVPSKFEEIFSKYAKTAPDRMNFNELLNMTMCMQNAYDLFGWSANKLEWGILYWLVKDADGYCSKDAIRGVFDGSFFVYAESVNNAKKGRKHDVKKSQ
ncbi:unnamed protein product [Calypogeia fissa]